MKQILILFTLLACSCIYGKARPATSDSAQNYLDSFNKYYKEGIYSIALSWVSKASEFAQASNDPLLVAKSLNNTGLIYSSQGDPARSIYYYDKSLAILRRNNIQPQLSTALLNLGIAFKEQAIYDKALAYLYEAASYFEKAKDQKQLAAAYNTIGNILRIEKDYKKALFFHFQALSLRKQIGYEEGISGSINNIGATYKAMEQYDSALTYLKAALTLKQAKSRPDKLANTLSQIGDIFIATHDYTQARTYYLEAYKIRKEIDNKSGISMSLYEIGNLYYLLQDMRTAEQYLLQCIALSEEINSTENKLTSYNVLKDLYKSTSNYSKSLFYLEKYVSLHDSILGLEKQKALTQLEIKFETEKLEREIDDYTNALIISQARTREQNLQIEANKNDVLTMWIIVISLAIFIILLFFLLRNRNKYAKKLDTLMRELHHRVMNNFQVLSSLFQLQLNHIPKGSAYETLLSNNDRISAMMLIHKDLYLENNITRVKMKDYVVSLVQNLLTVHQGTRPVQVNYDISSSLELDVEKAIPLGLLLNELVTNALKYAFTDQNEDPVLEISFTQEQDGSCILRVKDNGPGIQHEGSERSLGLKLAESMVKQLRGTIIREQDHGLCYEVRFRQGT